MANLSTKYMGLDLKNPIVVGASNLVTDIKNLKKLEEAGAAAIVYKSLFEEQLQLEEMEMDAGMNQFNDLHAEMTSIFPEVDHAGPAEYLMNFKQAKEALSIPLIASVNAVYDFTWIEYAQQLEEAGAAAIELNFFSIPKDFDTSAADIEAKQLKVVEEIKKGLSIPVAVKMSPAYTNTLNVIKKMDEAGTDGFVLFNRLFEPEIDIEKEEHHHPWNLSHEGDHRQALRYAGLLHGNINASIISSMGVLSAEQVIQLILAGADAVQVVSTLYKNKLAYVETILNELEAWMDKKGYASLDDFRGKLSKNNTKDIRAYKRAQYIDILFNSHNVFDSYQI